MKQINGFTLFEMLLTIVILASLVLLAVPSIFSTIQKQEIAQFFKILDSDILYIQNQALGTRQNVRIVFDQEYYAVLTERQSEEIKRYYPKQLTHEVKINNRLSFSNNGTVINPTTYLFKDKDTTYHLVFPLGKGRHYIEQQ
ncbi:competence type IV pilus minor pilin ComGD [Pseudogracilibacillus sp. SE30717A]|uniref:competence type IV pilus minor pilin ComGD n=1 Tax=Pseudogracilibacillus sp. SE30717A TaxID=3098293 RepID=UPI00300DD730